MCALNSQPRSHKQSQQSVGMSDYTAIYYQHKHISHHKDNKKDKMVEKYIFRANKYYKEGISSHQSSWETITSVVNKNTASQNISPNMLSNQGNHCIQPNIPLVLHYSLLFYRPSLRHLFLAHDNLTIRETNIHKKMCELG